MQINRQSLKNRITHWGIALSIFGLIITGIFEMPIAKRYNITKLIDWSGDYFFNLSLHYIFGFALIFFAFFHVVSHFFAGEFDAFPKRGDVKNSYLLIKAMILGKKEPPSEKYLPEQRLAYLAIAFVIAVLIVSGLIKTYKNLIGFDISNSLYYWAATLHNFGMVAIILLIIAHLLAFIPKENRNLLSAMFSGKVDAKYTLHRHSLWKKGCDEAREILSKEKSDKDLDMREDKN